MPTITTREYLLDKAKRRITTSPFLTVPGMGKVEKRLLARNWPQHAWAEAPAGSDLKPVMGDNGLPILGHIIEMFRGGPDFWLHLYRTRGPVSLLDSPILPSVVALGPDAAQVLYANRNKDFSQQGWAPAIEAFFNRGLMLLDFDEHMYHRRIMQEAFVRTRLAGYTEQVDKVVSRVIANDWVANDARFLLYPAMKELTLDIASMVFMGHEPGSDRELVTKVNRAFTVTTRAGNAIIRTSVPPFTWWRGLKAREYLEDYFDARVKERRGKDGSDLLSVLCQSEDEDGNKFSDEDIVNHMIFLMMAAHDTSTSTATTMSHYLAANPEWQERCRDESDRLGDGPLDIEALEKLESLDLVMNESIRLVSPVQWAMRRTVRDTELARLLPARGHERHRVSGHEPSTVGDLSRSLQIRPGPLRGAAQRAQEAPLRLHAVRRRRAQVHWHGVRPARNQDDHAPTASPVSPRTGAARLRASLRLRRHARADGRHADRAAATAVSAKKRSAAGSRRR